MTFGDATWLLFGAGIGVMAAVAIPYGMHAIGRVAEIHRTVETERQPGRTDRPRHSPGSGAP